MPPATGNDSFQKLGDQYEHLTMRVLEKCLGMQPRKVGGRGDAGIDLWAKWALPDKAERTVLVQCKRISRKAPPILIRELEGTMMGTGVPGLIGLLACTTVPSSECISRVLASQFPLMLLQITDDPDEVIRRSFMSHRFRVVLPKLQSMAVKLKDTDEARLRFAYEGVFLDKSNTPT